MLIDLLCTGNYTSFNAKLAHIIGLEAAIYVNELLNINEKAIRKAALSDEFINLDREYVYKRTTLTIEKQLEIETKLAKINLLYKNDINPNQLSLNLSVLTGLFMPENEESLVDISKITKAKVAKATTKAQAVMDNLKMNITTDNDELRSAYFDWIETIFMKQGWMSKKCVTAAQATVDTFSNHDLDIALKIVEIAAVNGYRDMEWAVNKYREKYQVTYMINPVQLNINNNDSTALGEDIF